MNRGEIRLEQGDFVFSCDGVTQPLVCQELQLILLRNCERFMLGEISAEQYETVYSRCLEVEQTGRRSYDQTAEGRLQRSPSIVAQASIRT